MPKKLHAVDRYARDVLKGKIVAGPLVRLACERHQRDVAAKRWVFDGRRADHIIEFFAEFLRLPDTVTPDGDPAPFKLEPWQVFTVGSLFGWVDADGGRRYREGFVETGKGSGKTPLLAGIGLYGLVMDGERAAEIYSAAVDRDQATIMFRDAKRICEASPELAGRIKSNVGNLSYEPTMSFFRPFSREQGQKSGTRPHMALIDEVHEHPTGEIINKMRAGVKKRRQPLVLEITNSGFDRTSICWEHHEHARKVLERTVEDERFFAFVCGLDEGDDPLTDESCWPKANPAIGVTVTRDYLRRQVENAKNIPAETNTVLRLNFCVWTQSDKRFFGPGDWDRCKVAVSDAEMVGKPCYGGIDLGESDDLSAWAIVWDLQDGRLAVRVRFWTPEASVQKFKDRPYPQWVRAGWLELTDGNTTDYDLIERAIQTDCERYGVGEVRYDKRFAAQMALHLQAAGIEMIDQPQGYQLNESIKRLSEAVAGRTLCHDGNPVLASHADNFVTRTGLNQEQRPDKPNAKGKIDGVVALLQALAAFIVAVPETSVYETRGMITL